MNKAKTELDNYDKYLIEQIAFGKLRQFLCSKVSNTNERLRYTSAKHHLLRSEILYEHKQEFGYELSINLSHPLIKKLHL